MKKTTCQKTLFVCRVDFASRVDVTWKNDASTETLVFFVRTLHIGTFRWYTSVGVRRVTLMKKTTCQKTLYHVALDTAYNAGYHDYFNVTQKRLLRHKQNLQIRYRRDSKKGFPDFWMGTSLLFAWLWRERLCLYGISIFQWCVPQRFSFDALSCIWDSEGTRGEYMHISKYYSCYSSLCNFANQLFINDLTWMQNPP